MRSFPLPTFAGIVTAWFWGCLLCGCGGRVTVDPVNPAQARETLQKVLQSWQQGESPGDWRQKSPPVVVQDPDWSAGLKLKNYELVGTGKPLDANLYCEVKLTLTDPQKGERQKSVTYVVGTDPVLTVFRDLLR